LVRDINTVATQYFFKAVQWQTVHIFGGQQHRQNAGGWPRSFQSVELACLL
jgi:hypothetical protein